MQETGETARAHMKACTDSVHRRLHEVPLFDGLLRGTASLQEYAMLMSVLAVFYRTLDASLENACIRHPEWECQYKYRPRAPLIEADVAAVGRKVGPIVNRHAASLQSTLPIIDSRASLAGVIYVVDGATLGGRLLNKAAARLLNDDDAGGRSYWQWCDDHGALQWKAALVLVEACGQEQSQRRDMVEAALATFEALEEQFAIGAPVGLAGAA
ncbi:MAG: biliverdin-producing heme oxygenase [Alphaproteobacteria bacterium]|nr:biliverdin-producing heme oxygenase [Alphaproteobacteria bacterium]